MSLEPTLSTVLLAYGHSARAVLTPLEGGLINRTYRVDEAGRRAVLQRLNPIFAPTVNRDIWAITEHLARHGLTTPRIVPTVDGALWTIDGENYCWRMLSWLDGESFAVMSGPALANSAAQLVARFHGALRDLTHSFHFARPEAHDTPLHLARLEAALDAHAQHPRRAEVGPLAEAILTRARALPALPSGPKRVVHGDLKISNVMFSGEQALALVDLDTVASLTIPIEIGDALRSWCNPAGEDAQRVYFREDVFEAAMEGYLPLAGWLEPAEREALVLGAETIALELAARFCADALNESYFGWNPNKFASRSEHNQVRAESQLALAGSIAAQRGALEQRVAQIARHATAPRG